MLTNDEFTTNIWVTICAVGSVLFVCIPYFVNIYFAANIKNYLSLSKNECARSYFENYSSIFVTLVCLCGGVHPALTVCSSAMFGLNVINSGLTKHELKQLHKIKVIGTVIFENLPQVLFACFFFL